MKITTLLETNTTPSSDPAGLQSQQAPKFGRNPNVLEDDTNLEETTTAGAIATGTPSNLGVQRRGTGALLKGITTSKKFPNSQGVTEEFDSEYDDEAGMASSNLHTIARAAEGLLDTIDDNENLPEWAQEKIAKVEGMLVAVWDYLKSQEEQGIDPEVNETAAWRRKEGKNKKGGLNAKGVASYRRENPGSKLQTAVTTKPSKLKPGSKDAKRRKSFCARMGGMKGPMKKPNGEPTRKALSLRKWNCESVEQTVNLLGSVRQELAEMKQRLDPKCWKGYKKQGTKVKGGVRVNNCVPAEGVEEGSDDKNRIASKKIILKNFIKIAKEQGNHQRVQKLELELKKLDQQGVAEANRNIDPEQEIIDATRRARLSREREPEGSEKIDSMLAQHNAQLQQYNQTGKFWLKTKDTQRHFEGPFIGKQTANKAALDLLKQRPELKGNILITAWGPNETPQVDENLSEEQILVKDLFKQLDLFKKGADRELGKKPKDKEIQKKK